MPKSSYILIRAIQFLGVCVAAGVIVAPAQAYTYFSHPTAWDPGANTARVGGFPSPGAANWSIMGAGIGADPLSGDFGHTGLTADITALGVPAFGTAAAYAAVFDAALDVWASASDFTNLGEIPDAGADAGALESSGGHLADIRIAAWEIASPSVLAHAYQPGTETIFGPGGTIAGDTHFDIDRDWIDDPHDVSGNGKYDLFTVALHEFGHALGLGHSVAGTVMAPTYAGAMRSLSADDAAGISSIYGSRSTIPEPGSILLFSTGLLGLAAYTRRRKRA